jgi:hypothetical protein
MTSVLTAAAVEQGPDWGGFGVVMGMLGLSLVAAVTDLFHRAGDDVGRMVDEALTIDHEQCRHGGCDVVICYCRIATACEGTEKPGCPHVSLVCDDHRVEDCEGCRTDARADAGVPW